MIDGAVEVLLFVALAVVIGVIGVRVGMLLAPRLSRFAERHDEDDRGGD